MLMIDVVKLPEFIMDKFQSRILSVSRHRLECLHIFQLDELFRSANCENCITPFDLYDGRVEVVCKKCLKYVDLFMESGGRKFLKLMLHIKAHFEGHIKNFIYEYSEDLPADVQKFFDFLENFEETFTDDHLESLADIDTDIVFDWILENVHS